jgi:hypothetical protein
MEPHTINKIINNSTIKETLNKIITKFRYKLNTNANVLTAAYKDRALATKLKIRCVFPNNAANNAF